MSTSAAVVTVVTALGNNGFSVDMPVTANGGYAVVDQSGGINVAAPITLNNTGKLTLNANGPVSIDAAITVTGAGRVQIFTDVGYGQGGDYNFALGPNGFAGSLSFTGTPNSGQSLSINGQAYTLLYSLADIAALPADATGDYALAKPINAAGTTYTGPVGSDFEGVFAGLGNTVANLTINDPTGYRDGLFNSIGLANGGGSQAQALVRDIGLTGVNITGGLFVGALTADNNGTIANSFVTGSVTAVGAPPSAGEGYFVAGGLVGLNTNGITQSYSAAAVISTAGNPGSLGGLAGQNNGGILGSYATGALTAGVSVDAGGLVGDNQGTLSGTYASGAVTGTTAGPLGGLVGYNDNSIGQSYATGAVTATGPLGAASGVGGLVGQNGTGGAINQDYATGAVGGADQVGGLVGQNVGAITNSHATGAISAPLNAYSAGGLVGLNEASGTIGQSYSASTVTSAGYDVGGLVGDNEGSVNQGSASGAINVANNGGSAGGLVGYNGGQVIQSQASGAVIGPSSTGGLVGANWGTINASSASGSVTGAALGYTVDVGGLVGQNASSGSITQSYATGGVSAQSDVGGLVGFNNGGSITQSYATGVVTGGVLTDAYGNSFTTAQIGGLVGDNAANSRVSLSHATGAVNAANSGDVGGLIGENDGDVTQSYATNVVTGGGAVGGLVGQNLGAIAESYSNSAVTGTTDVGGLVGYNANQITGTITEAYATGAVTGGTNVGGLVGANSGGVIASAYWDIQTSGQAASAAGVGQTTAQLQASLPKGFSSVIWGQVAGKSFPYLNWQFTTGAPDVIGGNVYGGFGGPPMSGVMVDGLVNGAPVGEDTTGANGYYLLLLPHGTLKNADVLTYLAGPQGGAAYADGVTGSAPGLWIAEGGLNIFTGATSVTGLDAGLASALGSNTGANVLFTLPGGVLTTTAGTSLSIQAKGAFNVNQPLTVSGGTLTIDAFGALIDNQALNGQLINLTAMNGGAITLAAPITASNGVTLNAGASIIETGAGAISAAALAGTANGAVSLNGANQISSITGFSNNGPYGFGLTDTTALWVNGALNAGAGALSIHDSGAGLSFNAPISAGANASLQTQGSVTLNSTLTTGGPLQIYAFGGAISEGVGGIIAAPALSGGAQGLDLPNANAIGTLAGFGRTGTADPITLNDTQPLTVTGAVSAGQGSIQITAPTLTIGASMVAIGNISLTAQTDLGLTAAVTATGNETLTAQTGAISEGTSGVAWAMGLTTSSAGATTLNGANHVSQILGASADGFSLNDTVSLAINGTVNAGAGSVTFTGTTTGGLYVNAPVSAAGTGSFTTPGWIALNSSVTLGGAMSVNTTVFGVLEGVGGTINAPSLTGNAASGLYLAGANQIGALAGFTTATAGVTVIDARPLAVTGPINAGAASVDLGTTVGGLSVNAPVTGGTYVYLWGQNGVAIGGAVNAGGAVYLNSQTGDLTETAGGSLTGSSLVVSTNANTILNGPNSFGALAGVYGFGAVTINDLAPLTVTGEVDSVTGAVTLTSAGNLTLSAPVTSPTAVTLTSGGAATETAGGQVKTNTINVTAQTGINLGGANTIAHVGVQITTSGPNQINP